MKKRILSLILTAAVSVSVFAMPALAAALGDVLHTAGVEIADGTQLAKGVYWNSAYSDKLAENYIEYSPSSTVTPIVAYGGSILSGNSFSSLARELESEGMHVIGGINGDYYTLSNYQPLGLVMSEGVIKSSQGDFNAIGFRADGTAVIGDPGMKITVTLGTQTYPIATYNKTRESDGFALFDGEFAKGTGNTEEGVDIVLTPIFENKLTAECSLEFRVDIIEEYKGSYEIPKGCYVLSLNAKADDWRQGGVAALKPGDVITVDVTTSNSDWHDVEYAVGCYQKLVTKGSAESGLEGNANPRTAVGVKYDGTVVLYTVDGRQSGHSAGITMSQLAERLIELGCADAGMLDGGGSTNMSALYIGEESISQINSPSDGSARAVTNYIMLVTTEGASGDPARLGVYPYDILMLAGASKSFDVKAADSAGYPARLPELSYSLEEGLGTLDGATFTAGSRAGDETLVVSGGGAQGFATIKIVETPHVVTVYNEDTWKAVNELTIYCEQSIELYAAATYNRISLETEDSCFTWELDGDIGEIDEDGHFTAGLVAATGEIKVTAGEKTVTIPVTVKLENPFTDIKKDDWFYEAVLACYDEGLINGVEKDKFGPMMNMTRSMFVTILSRLEQSGEITGYESSFTDVPSGEWYSEAVAWASEKGLVKGYDDGGFHPNDNITREQMCTLVVRYADMLAVELRTDGDTESYADADKISAYALEAAEICRRAGLVTGKEGNIFDPLGTATRAELTVVIQRLLGQL